MLARILRLIHRLVVERRPDVGEAALERLAAEVRQAETAQMDERLDQLIRHQRITSRMATSLMNDAGYAFNAARALIRAGEVLYRAAGSNHPDEPPRQRSVEQGLRG